MMKHKGKPEVHDDPRVKVYIQGKHGRIGIIVPDHKPTEEEWKEFNESMAEIVYKVSNEGKKGKDTDLTRK